MNPKAVIAINLALVLYSIGVWAERIQGRLKVWHTIFFWLGLVCDTCLMKYPITDGIPVMLVDEAEKIGE